MVNACELEKFPNEERTILAAIGMRQPRWQRTDKLATPYFLLVDEKMKPSNEARKRYTQEDMTVILAFSDSS